MLQSVIHGRTRSCELPGQLARRFGVHVLQAALEGGCVSARFLQAAAVLGPDLSCATNPFGDSRRLSLTATVSALASCAVVPASLQQVGQSERLAPARRVCCCCIAPFLINGDPLCIQNTNKPHLILFCWDSHGTV